ncbi:MAG: N-acetylmuramoyl-L-alanine amidase [Lachnospiraceae bacterium]|nr:N-acetylmuramoyl-L-alanine amidase [Lachnospiraceae bacterium]
MVACMIYIAKEGAKYTNTNQVVMEEPQICIVLDAGHGGDDPGKIGINGSMEKEINLAITQKVKTYLEANDIKVVLTREDDAGLYDAGTENKKVQDMKRRIAIMEEAKPLATVSIHQNSYPEEYVKGAQVFYHKDSKEGERLATLLQENLRVKLEPENHRQIKANDSYYLLKKTQIPTVIVECGFLSNSREAVLLSKEEYQDKVAWAIHMGILQFINSIKRE